MRRHSTGRSAPRSSRLGQPGGPFWRPSRATIVFGLAVALLVHCLDLDVGRDDDVQGAFISLIITGVVAAFGWLADKAVTIAVIVWHATQIVGGAIVRFAIGLGQILGRVYHLFAQFWSQVLRPFIGFVWRNIERLQTWLKQTMGPVLKFLEQVRKRVFDIYDRYFRPILDTIDVARGALRILATFRVEWARELDRKLAELQEWILWPIREVMLRLNEAMNWINRIVTLDGLFQRLTLLRSITRDIGRIGAIWHAAASRPLTAEERRTNPALPPTKTPEQSISDFQVYLRTGDGPHRAAIDEAIADLRLKLRNV
jgi:hypothetical protein